MPNSSGVGNTVESGLNAGGEGETGIVGLSKEDVLAKVEAALDEVKTRNIAVKRPDLVKPTPKNRQESPFGSTSNNNTVFQALALNPLVVLTRTDLRVLCPKADVGSGISGCKDGLHRSIGFGIILSLATGKFMYLPEGVDVGEVKAVFAPRIIQEIRKFDNVFLFDEKNRSLSFNVDDVESLGGKGKLRVENIEEGMFAYILNLLKSPKASIQVEELQRAGSFGKPGSKNKGPGDIMSDSLKSKGLPFYISKEGYLTYRKE